MSASGTDAGRALALSAIDGWGADFAAAAAVGQDGSTHRRGDTDHVVGLASITKLCTAWAALVAIEEGAFTLADPAGPPGATVRHLLCHASGLAFDADTVLAEPGTRRIYSNTGYDALADHIAATTGIPFEHYLHEAVLAPLVMTRSELRGSAAKDLHSTVEDLLRFAEEMVAPTLLADDTVNDALEPQLPSLAGVVPGWGTHDPCPWGLGPELRGTKSPHWSGATASPSTFGHFGGSGTMLWVDPGASVRCIALTDRPFGDWAVAAWPSFSDAVRAAYR